LWPHAIAELRATRTSRAGRGPDRGDPASLVERPSDADPLDDIKRLVRHWPIYPALLIWLLWNFAPGSGTPLQYYLQDTLHAKDASPHPSFPPSLSLAFCAASTR
jgi:hypothetical protein